MPEASSTTRPAAGPAARPSAGTAAGTAASTTSSTTSSTSANTANAASGTTTDNDGSASQVMRQLGQRAHQLRATARAAEHFSAQGNEADRNTGSWLMSCALAMAGDLSSEVDALARMLKEQPADLMFKQTVALLRVRAHQVHAATRAADHFLDGDSAEDQDTGGWLVSTAYTLAKQLAAEVDDGTTPLRRPAVDKATIEPHDPALARRLAQATALPQTRGAG